MLDDLKRKVVIITGATSGIGRATAIAFGAAGAKVVACGRRTPLGEELVRTIEAQGGEALFVTADVSIAAEAEGVVRAAVDRFGRLDVAFNNAGTGSMGGRLADQSEDSYDAVFNINVRGLWLSMKYEIQQMLKQGGGGSIINCSSIYGHVATPYSGHYTASKHAVEGYTKMAALEYAADGIRINAVAPGVIEAPLGGDLLEGKMRQKFVTLHPLGFFGEPMDVAQAVMFLASDVSRFITGTSVRVDGGYLTQ